MAKCKSSTGSAVKGLRSQQQSVNIG